VSSKRYSKPPLIPLTLDCLRSQPLCSVSYESLPVQELTLRSVTCSHSCTLKMEAIRSSEKSVLIRATRRHLPEDDNHHSHRRGNLKSYIVNYCLINHIVGNCAVVQAVSRRLLSSLHPRSGHVESVVEKVTLVQAF
jgi:hypothetical protein